MHACTQIFMKCTVFGLALSLGSAGYTQEVVRIAATPQAPDVVVENDLASGPAVDLITRVISELGFKPSVVVTPNYGRAFNDLRSGSADIMAFCTRNAERDLVAVHFPLAAKVVYAWYSKAGSSLDVGSDSFKEKTPVGAFLNSNTGQWLTDNGYKNLVGISTFDSMARMLDMGRVPVVFAVAAAFEGSMVKEQFAAGKFDKKVQVERTVGFYFSNAWLQAHPNMEQKIRASIAKHDYAVKR